MRSKINLDWLQSLMSRLHWRFECMRRFGWWLWEHTNTRCPYCINMTDDDEWEVMCDCWCWEMRHPVVEVGQ